MTEAPADLPLHSADQVIARVIDWWENGRDDAGRVNLAVERDTPAVSAVLRQIHRRVPGSVLLDATGKTADALLNELLDHLGVPESPRLPWNWDDQVKRLGTDHLVLIDHAPSAGPTRHSAQPELVVRRLAEQLSLADGLGAVLAVPLDHDQRTGCITLRLDTTSPATAPEAPAPADLPFPVRALAFSEPRHVPLPVWRELMAATATAGLDGPSDQRQLVPQEDELESLAGRFPGLLHHADGLISFADEGLAAAIRQAHAPEVAAAVGRHLVAWLREQAPVPGHPEGWAASGPLGRYAAHGIAAHAAQAGLLDELLSDGTIVAHIPPDALLDTAHRAYKGSLPGNTPAADAVHLRMYGVHQPDQPTWAAWLHLMATARNDTALADGITRSGLRLPWKTLWTHWRPPGGYHHTYLHPGPIDDLFPVRWHNHPAVLASGDDNGLRLWDPFSGALLAGPWPADQDFPADARPALTWYSDAGRPTPGPASLHDLVEHAATSEGWAGAMEGPLYVSLTLVPPAPETPVIVVAGPGGLFAVQPQPGTDISTHDAAVLHHPYVRQLIGPVTAAGPASPAGAPDPSSQDLADIYGTDMYVTTAPDDLPEGLADPTARRVLTTSGLPAMDDQGLSLEPSAEDFLAELDWPSECEEPEETGPFFRLGHWMGGHVVLDGPTGHVLRRPADPDDPTAEDGVLVATDLARFLTMTALWITGRRTLAEIDNRAEAHLLRQHISDALWSEDWEAADAGAWIYPLHNE